MTTIVDYGAGNLTSVRLALEHIGVPCAVASDPARISAAARVVFPGVGAAAAAIENLRRMELVEVLRDVVSRGTPFLGICLGAQIILEHSEENGGTECIGLLSGTVERFAPSDPADKIPQMGWNAVEIARMHPVLEGVEDGSEFYFVHSYYPVPSDESCAVGRTEYAGVRFASIIGRNNLIATQFHPERSGRIGLRLLDNFSRWNGRC